jgi:hypothetical protein
MHVISTEGLEVTSLETTTDLHGFLCPDITLEFIGDDFVEFVGEENGVLGPHTTIDALAIWGVAHATPLGQMIIGGTLTATPGQQDKYG